MIVKAAYTKPVLVKRQSLSQVTADVASPSANGSSTNGSDA
jgi:hypothetical protein